MSVKPPRMLRTRQTIANPLEALEHEVLQEKMATLSRLGRRLEKTLEQVAAFEAAASEGDRHGEAAAEREMLLSEAGEALWHFVIQREAMGLRNTEQMLRQYRVPPAVRARMGMARRPKRSKTP